MQEVKGFVHNRSISNLKAAENVCQMVDVLKGQQTSFGWSSLMGNVETATQCQQGQLGDCVGGNLICKINQVLILASEWNSC